MVQYKQLTRTERAIIGNGCGPRLFFIPSIKTAFRPDCDAHDFRYSRGGLPWLKIWADLVFWVELFRTAFYTGWKFPFYIFLAFSFGFWVLLYGWPFFRYSIKTRSKEEIIDYWLR